VHIVFLKVFEQDLTDYRDEVVILESKALALASVHKPLALALWTPSLHLQH